MVKSDGLLDFRPPKSGMGKSEYDAEADYASNGGADGTYREAGEDDQLRPNSASSSGVGGGGWDDDVYPAAVTDDDKKKRRQHGGGGGGGGKSVGFGVGVGGGKMNKFHSSRRGYGGGGAGDKRRCPCGLTKLGCVVVILLGVLVLALAGFALFLGLKVLWRRTLDVEQTCMEPECLRASAMLRGSVNTSVSPCGGVWEFSCGSWLKSNPIPPTKSKWGVFEKLRFQAIEAYRSLVNTLPQPLEPDQLPWKLKNFYDSCMDLDNINIDQARQLKYDIRELGGWAVLRTWNPNTFDHHNVLKKLHATYRVEPFFTVRVVPNDKDPQNNIIKIGPSGLGLPDRSYYFRGPDDSMIAAYQQYLEDTAKEMGAQGPDAKQFAQNMFHLEKRIAEFTPEPEVSDNPVATYNRITLRSLKTIAPSVPWLEIVREVYPEAGVTAATPVLIVSKKYVQDVSQLFFTNDKQALNNFFMWKLTATMVPYLSTKYRAVYDLYHVDTSGAKEPIKRWELCANILEDHFGHAVGALYWERFQERQSITSAVEDMFKHLKDQLVDDIASNKLLSEEMKSRGVEKVQRLTLQVAYPEKMMQDQYLEQFYKKMTVQKNDLYRNVLYGVYYKRMMEQDALQNPRTEDGFRWRNALLADEPTYVHQSNILVVPPYVLQAPFFNPGFPRSFNYGSVGALMAKAMLGVIDEVGVHYAADGILDPHFEVALAPSSPGAAARRQTSNDNEVLENTTGVSVSASGDGDGGGDRGLIEEPDAEAPEWTGTAHLARPRQCLRQAFQELELGTADQVSVAVNCSSMDVAGLRLALHALEASMLVEEERPQPGLPYFPEGIFFLSYAQMFCGDVTKEQEAMDLIATRCFSSKTRLRAVVTQLREFGYAFDCDGGDWSSSSRKCGRII